MSVASRNPFALLDEDASRPASPTPAPKAAAPAPTPATRGTQKPRGGPASRGGRYYQRGGKSAPRENGDVAAEDAEPRKRADGEGRGRGRGRGRGVDRGRGGRGRPFDRHSQTGKTDSDKKIHQGWGGDEPVSELNAEAAAATDAAAEKNEWTNNTTDGAAWDATPAAEGEAPAGEKGEGRKPREPREPREPEEEDNTLTLDEYLKQKQSLDIVPKLEARKVDDSDLKNAVVITKKDEDEDAYFVGKAKTSAPKPRAKKEEKVYIEIDARFERPSRGGGRGRGERGGERGTRGGRGRGGAGRGRATNGNSAPTALNVDDETAFPSLA